MSMVFAGVAIGGLVGAFNGFFVAYFRLQAVVVTLASMFIVLSLSLLIMPNPGGHVPDGLTKFFTGDLIPGVFPAALAVILFALLVWAAIKNSPFGTALYAVGSNADAARAQRHFRSPDAISRICRGRPVLRRRRRDPQAQTGAGIRLSVAN